MPGPLSYSLAGYRPRSRGRRAVTAVALAAALAAGAGAGWGAHELTADRVATTPAPRAATPAPTTAGSLPASQTDRTHAPSPGTGQ